MITILTNFAGIAFVSNIDEKIVELCISIMKSTQEVNLEAKFLDAIKDFN
jgi:hypothetical protein